jgi:hypothetical protein
MKTPKTRRIFTIKKISFFALIILGLYSLAGVFYSWVVDGGDVGSLLRSVKTAKYFSSFVQFLILAVVWWYWEKIVVLPSKPKAHKALRDARNNLCIFGAFLLLILSIV